MRKKEHILKRCLGLIMAIMVALGCFGVPEFSGGIFPVEVSAKASGSFKKKAAKEICEEKRLWVVLCEGY